MRVYIEKITTVDLMRRACKFTTHGQVDSMMSLDKIYRCEHSPLRTQMFWIEMYRIPTFVSVHLTRHKIGVEHWVQTNRDDRIKDIPGCSATYKGFTSEFFKDTFEYREGELYWKVRLHENSKYAVGDRAGGLGADGRHMVGVGGHRLYISVIIFMMFHGYRPPVVDHIDGNKTDNRIQNLRPATFAQNLQNNQRRKEHNSLGFKGIKQERSGKYVARIQDMGISRHLGTFDTPEEAALAYDAAAVRYFGEFAAVNFPDSERPVTRNDEVNHAMLINAQALINMARKRLCHKAHPETRLVFEHIKDCMKPVDPDLARYMVPECVYRGDVCHELRPCGKSAW